MREWIERLFGSDVALHGHCYQRPEAVLPQAIFSALIGLAYLGIALTIAYILGRVRELPNRRYYLGFCLLLLSCGAIHLVVAWAIWTPLFWLDSSARAATAMASVGSAALLAPIAPRLVALTRAARVARERGARLRQVNAELSALYQQARDSLAEAAEREQVLLRAQEAVQRRDVFLAVAAHELRTPLTPLRLEIERLLRAARGGQLERLAPERVTERLQVVDRQVGRLTELVDVLLDMTRIAGGRLELQLADVDLGEVVQEVTERLRPHAQRVGSALTVEVEPGITGRWDRLRLDQVVTNLISNALRYGQGKPVTVSLKENGGRAQLTVRDQGIGIAAEDQARIFERFERAVSERHYGGLGLGLWIVQQVVEAFGGTIRVESAPGEGATFVVELPREALPEALVSGERPLLSLGCSDPEAAEAVKR